MIFHLTHSHLNRHCATNSLALPDSGMVFFESIRAAPSSNGCAVKA